MRSLRAFLVLAFSAIVTASAEQRARAEGEQGGIAAGQLDARDVATPLFGPTILPRQPATPAPEPPSAAAPGAPPAAEIKPQPIPPSGQKPVVPAPAPPAQKPVAAPPPPPTLPPAAIQKQAPAPAPAPAPKLPPAAAQAPTAAPHAASGQKVVGGPRTPPPLAPAPKPAAPTPQAAPPVAAGSEPPAKSPPPSGDRITPALLRGGPSLYETGRVGKMGVSEAGTRIGQTQSRAMPGELPVDSKLDDGSAPAASGPVGVMNPGVLKREIKSRFALLKNCPNEVAHNRRIAAATITASRLTLRWTILPGGQVANTQVVATAPTDGQVLNCVKREMSQWSFTPPRGGPVHIERPFRFRSPGAASGDD
ncbi:MAG: AgmX/PglI C-terminal domain-containing protein [Pseudomonadota bacterium]